MFDEFQATRQSKLLQMLECDEVHLQCTSTWLNRFPPYILGDLAAKDSALSMDRGGKSQKQETMDWIWLYYLLLNLLVERVQLIDHICSTLSIIRYELV